MPESDTDIEKKRLRKEALERRADAKATTGPLAGDLLAAQFTGALPLATGTVVAGYWPMRDEINPVPLLKRLHQNGIRVVLPTVAEKGEPLRFRNWEPDQDLESGPYGTLHPPASVGEARPDAVLVPLLAFDDDGYRLGYGGGYYDRTLSALRAGGTVLAVGIGYESQRTPPLPRSETDERLDWMVTENSVRRFA